MNLAAIVKQDNRLIVSGDLTFATVNALWQQSLSLLSNSPELNFDFSGAKTVNSAGLALLIEWIKYARQHKKNLHFSQLPDEFRSIGEAAGIPNNWF